MECPICRHKIKSCEHVYVWDDISKQNIRICSNIKCAEAFKRDLRRRHKTCTTSKEILP